VGTCGWFLTTSQCLSPSGECRKPSSPRRRLSPGEGTGMARVPGGRAGVHGRSRAKDDCKRMFMEFLEMTGRCRKAVRKGLTRDSGGLVSQLALGQRGRTAGPTPAPGRGDPDGRGRGRKPRRGRQSRERQGESEMSIFLDDDVPYQYNLKRLLCD